MSYGYQLNEDTILSCLKNINCDFVRENHNKKLKTAKDILGLNIIIRDGIINTPIINLHKLSNIFEKHADENFKLKVNAGISIPKFSKYLINKGLTGYEGLVGFPGSLGGGIVMNISSYSSCISDYLVSVEYIDENGELLSLNKSEINFGFRKFYQSTKSDKTVYLYDRGFAQSQEISAIMRKSEGMAIDPDQKTLYLAEEKPEKSQFGNLKKMRYIAAFDLETGRFLNRLFGVSVINDSIVEGVFRKAVEGISVFE